MNCLVKTFQQYVEYQKSIVDLACLLPKSRKLSKTDLQRIAVEYVKMGGDLSFLDNPPNKTRNKSYARGVNYDV